MTADIASPSKVRVEELCGSPPESISQKMFRAAGTTTRSVGYLGRRSTHSTKDSMEAKVNTRRTTAALYPAG